MIYDFFMIAVSVFGTVCCLQFESNGVKIRYNITKYGTFTLSPINRRIVSIPSVSVNECVHQCAKRPKCEGLYYRRKFKLCELVSENGDLETSPSPDCWFIKRSDIVIENTACNKECSNEQDCDGNGTCVPKVNLECGYPEVANGKPAGNMFSVGDRQVIECDSGFSIHGSKSLKCLKNGSWDNVPGCRKECYVSSFNAANVTSFRNSSGYYAVVICHAGYISNGTADTANEVTKETVTCGNDGKWIPNIDCIDSLNLYNIALKKPTRQSSVYKGYGSDRGTDGIWDPGFNVGKSCTHTQENFEDAWWEVDLLHIYVIRRVKILNRTEDYFAKRFQQVTATIGISPNPTDICGATYVGPAKSEEMVEFICTVTGRYVRLSKPNSDGSQNLVVCEVGVYEN